MQTFTNRVIKEFGKLLDERLESLTETLTEGSSLSMEKIRQVQGQFQGLREAKQLLDDAITICERET